MSITPAELDSLADSLAAKVAEKLAARPRLIDRVDLARQIGVSVPTIERLQRDGRIPVVRVGRRVLYCPAAVVDALAQRGGVNE